MSFRPFLVITVLLLALLPVRAAAAAAPVAAPADGRFGWPLAPPHPVLRPFQPPPDRFGPGHRGVDLGAPPGAVVLAAGTGVVVYAGTLAGRGVVSVAHPSGLRTTYEPVEPVVSAGQPVVRGQPLGTVAPGHPDCPAPACLHWGAKRGRDYVDPLRLVSGGAVRLLPWKDD
jgi:murein DD-endopeptidase MepM/ murein hydrolase activator NlpD